MFVINTNDVKPQLTTQNKYDRVIHGLTHVNIETLDQETYQFAGLFDEVHVDEKWFYLTKANRRYILVSDEELPRRSIQHKNHITKVMFLCAQARPRKIRGRMWDGKIGIWPVGRWKMAKRNTLNQTIGDVVWENETLDSDAYFDILLEKVVPAIIAKWPRGQFSDKKFTIKIQQDGAKPHTAALNMERFELKMQELWLEGKLPTRFKIVLYTQPANSPDLNILDLGFFIAIQALCCQEAPRNSKELINLVEHAYSIYPSTKINRAWLTLQCCMNQILGEGGGNHCKIPHMNKEKLEREDRLPRVVDVRQDVDGIIDVYRDPLVEFEERELEKDITFTGKVTEAECKAELFHASVSVRATGRDIVRNVGHDLVLLSGEMVVTELRTKSDFVHALAHHVFGV